MPQRRKEAIRSRFAGVLPPGARPASKGEVDDVATSRAGSLSTSGLSRSFSPQASPPLGLRGGLGKSLLIAFLLLAIVPLSLLAFLTYNQIQRDTRQRLILSLEEMVTLKGAYLVDWVEGRQRELILIAETLEAAGAGAPGFAGQEDALVSGRQALADWLAGMQSTDPAFLGLILVDEGAEPVATGAAVSGLDPDGAEWQRIVDAVRSPASSGALPPLSFVPVVGDAGSTEGRERLLPAVWYARQGKLLVGLLDWDALQAVLSADAIQFPGPTGNVETSLVTEAGVLIPGQELTLLAGDRATGATPTSLSLAGGLASQEEVSEGISQVTDGESGSGAYTNLAGEPVFGAYRWLPDLGVGILAEQLQMTSLAAGDTLTALVVGATLAVALLTAAIAAVVTRRITRPIVQLTQSAAWMARGDLDQMVPVTRNDEIGVLARAFNHMASELRVLYANLEGKVADRTRQLEEASQYTRYYLMQLAISAEVARVASSIRDLDLLLNRVVELIDGAFELHRTTIYLLDEERSPPVLLRAGGALPKTSRQARPLPLEVAVGGPSLVGQVAADGLWRVIQAGAGVSSAGSAARTPAASPAGAGREQNVMGFSALDEAAMCELALPLRVGDKILGVLDLQSTRGEDFGESDRLIYRSLADQISIAIENARAYAVERETVERLRELDRIQAEFLTNMSHALRTPLTSVIGFSRVLLKELDGPLTDLQQEDLTTIYESGRQLLGLINDMLELSHLDLGVAPFSPSEVDLAEIIEGVVATAQALARVKQIQVYADLPPALPTLYTDGQRVRQVVLALLSNAVKFTAEGSIRLAVSVDPGAGAGQEITISVSDTGTGIPELELQALFADRGHKDEKPDMGGVSAGREQSAVFGLAISKRVVERLGGRIWVESEEGVGSTFTFTLPVRLDEGHPTGGGHPRGGGHPAGGGHPIGGLYPIAGVQSVSEAKLGHG